MGFWDFINSSTEAVKRKAPDFARVNSLPRLDDETKSMIGTFAVKFGKNAFHYGLREGYKSVPGGVAASNIFSETMKEVRRETK